MKKFIGLVVLGITLSASTFAGDQFVEIYNALRVVPVDITPGGLTDVKFKQKAVGGLSCTAKEGFSYRNGRLTKIVLGATCTLQADERSDLNIFNALNVVESTFSDDSGSVKTTKTAGSLTCTLMSEAVAKCVLN
jgi:hypothetical protein